MKFLVRLDTAMQRYAWLPRWTLIIAAVICVYWIADRASPYGIISVDPAYAVPGSTVTIRWSMWRDTKRECSAEISRSMFDSKNDRTDYPVAFFSHEAILRMDAATPGRRAVTLAVPSTAAAGPALVVTTLQYECNRMHALWPIRVTTVQPFIILHSGS